jgi:hypothetical protein
MSTRRFKEAHRYLKDLEPRRISEFKVGDIIAKKALLLTENIKWYSILGTERVETKGSYDTLYVLRELVSEQQLRVPESYLTACVKYEVWENVNSIINGVKNE